MDQPHVAIFDFAPGLKAKPGLKLRLTLQQEYGQHLLLSQFRVSTSTHPTKYLTANVDAEASLRDTFKRTEFAATKAMYETLAKQQQQLAGLRAAIPKTPIMRELADNKQRDTRIHIRGNFLDPGEPAEPRVLELFGALPAGTSPIGWVSQTGCCSPAIHSLGA